MNDGVLDFNILLYSSSTKLKSPLKKAVPRLNMTFGRLSGTLLV